MKTQFYPSEDLNARLKKAAHVCPSPAQLKWMEREYVCFLHFSPNTMTGRQWGNGTETVSDYNPDALDPAQWVRVCKAAGMKMIIPTLKHHDGFCQWNTDTTDFSVRNAPVKVDVAEAVAQACRDEGIAIGVYLSPWDMNQRGRGVWGTPAYQQVFLDQLRELMTRYGKIDELWLDGACGDLPIWQAVPTYKPAEWYDIMEELQPDCVVRAYDPVEFASEADWARLKAGQGELKWRGKAVRWVGNEDGLAREDEWSVQPVFTRTVSREATFDDLGEEKYYEDSVGAVWYPNEVNTHLLNQWFWNAGSSFVRPLNELIDIFYHSIGNNGLLLMNLSPDCHGRIGEDQIQRLAEFHAFMENTFGTDLARGAAVQASEGNAECVLCEDDAFWSPDAEEWDVDRSTCSLELVLPEARSFDNLLIREAIAHGQRVARWRASARADGKWVEIANKRTIGRKVICRFPAVTTDRVRVKILRSWDTPMIARVSLHTTCLPEIAEAEQIRRFVIAPLDQTPEDLFDGVRYSVYDRGVQSAAAVGEGSEPAIRTGIAAEISHRCYEQPQDFSVCFDAYLYSPFARDARFILGSSDGAILTINGQNVINNDEPHAYSEKEAHVHLSEGYYRIRVQYTSFRNPAELKLLWTNPANELVLLAGI